MKRTVSIGTITLKSNQELNFLREAGKLCARTHDHLTSIIRPGISLLELDAEAEKFIIENGGTPCFKGYMGFPNTVCTSVNDSVVHGKPTDYQLKNGDIVTLDLGATVHGFHGDTAKTHIIGAVSPEIQKFVRTGYEALFKGIEQARAGNHVNDISNAVSSFINQHGYGIVREYVGHGIGKELHEAPQVGNTFSPQAGAELAPGMVICIEPILTMTKESEVMVVNEWNVNTRNGALACHWEHVVAITNNDPEILTLRDEEKL